VVQSPEIIGDSAQLVIPQVVVIAERASPNLLDGRLHRLHMSAYQARKSRCFLVVLVVGRSHFQQALRIVSPQDLTDGSNELNGRQPTSLCHWNTLPAMPARRGDVRQMWVTVDAASRPRTPNSPSPRLR
jgi:hypothetical protein